MAIYKFLPAWIEPKNIEKLETLRTNKDLSKVDFFDTVLSDFLSKINFNKYRRRFGEYERLYLNLYNVHTSQKMYEKVKTVSEKIGLPVSQTVREILLHYIEDV